MEYAYRRNIFMFGSFARVKNVNDIYTEIHIFTKSKSEAKKEKEKVNQKETEIIEAKAYGRVFLR